MDALLQRRRMMLNVGLDPDGTIYVNVIAHDETDHSWYSTSNISNAYAGDTSTTYAAINLTRGSEAETYVYFIFSPLSRIPANAYIYYIKCDIKCYTNAGSQGPGTFILCEGTTEVPPSVAIGSSSANHKTITSTKWTRAQLDNIRLKVHNKRGTTNVNTNYYDRFYGATLTIRYAIQPEPYLTFEDSEVESICATEYGDNIGTKQVQADLYTSTGLSFRGNTDIVSFDELGEYFTNITTITAGSSATVLGAFGGCTALESITLPDALITIGAYSFYNCTSLESISIPSLVTTIGASAFYGCSGLTGTLSLPSSLTSIGANAFQGCSGLTSVTIPSSVTSIGNSAFNGCSGLTGNMIVPSTVTSLGTTPFGGCTGLSNLYNFCSASVAPAFFNNVAPGGVIYCKGNCNGSTATSSSKAHTIIIGGYSNSTSAQRAIFSSSATLRALRVWGNINRTAYNGSLIVSAGNNTKVKIVFVELLGKFMNNDYGHFYAGSGIVPANTIIHLGYDTITNNELPCTPTRADAGYSNVVKIYVGTGESLAKDQAILDMYLADIDWAAYSSKLDLWYNYDGEFNTPVIPTI